jgi:hypothetical protein
VTQALAVRLLQRKTVWIRTAGLAGRYREVPDAAAAAQALHAAGLVLSACDGDGGGGGGDGGGGGGEGGGCGWGGEQDDMADRLGALTREELGAVARAEGLSGRGRRPDVTTALLSAPRQRVLAAWRAAMQGDEGSGGGGGSPGRGEAELGGALRLAADLVRAVRLVLFLTFLDFPAATLQSLVLQDVGAVRFPMRADDEDAAAPAEEGAGAPAVFSSRQALDEYVGEAEAAGVVDAALEAGDEGEALRLLGPVLAPLLALGRGLERGAARGGEQPVASEVSEAAAPAASRELFARFDPQWLRCALATVGVGLLERRGRHADATHVLLALLSGCAAPDRRGGWHVRAVTNLGSHLGRANAALRVAETGLADTWVRCGHRLGLQRRALRLGKRCKRWAVAAAPWRADAEWEARPAARRPSSHLLEPLRP